MTAATELSMAIEVDSFLFDPQPLTPPIDAPGVRVWSGKPRTEAGEMLVPIYATWCLAEPEFAALRDVGEALVLHASDADGGFAEAVKLIDPLRQPTDYAPNYRGNPTHWGHPLNQSIGTVSCTAHLPLPSGSTKLFFYVTLLGQVSNVLALDLKSGEGQSFLEGAPHALPNADLPAS